MSLYVGWFNWRWYMSILLLGRIQIFSLMSVLRNRILNYLIALLDI